jgi:hypothetical protein
MKGYFEKGLGAFSRVYLTFFPTSEQSNYKNESNSYYEPKTPQSSISFKSSDLFDCIILSMKDESNSDFEVNKKLQLEIIIKNKASSSTFF